MALLKLDSPDAPLPLIARCGACGLYRKCSHPKLDVMGTGKLPIMFVVDYPGQDESRWLAGSGGAKLKQAIADAGAKLSECIVTGALICNPGKAEVDTARLRSCLPNLVKAIRDFNPVVVVLLGQEAVSSVITHYWKSPAERLERWVGRAIPNQRPNLWLCPTWNPSYLARAREDLWLTNSFNSHIATALQIAREGERPWSEPPRYADKVERIYEPSEAARIIRKMVALGGLTAFDYETDRLKPDHPKAKVATCSICWKGRRTIAYPMQGEAIEATREYLKSDVPKIACNLKFEERWSMRFFKTRVRNWVWDTLNGAHFIDNRSEVTSIKFQSFALLGEPRYNSSVEATLKPSGESGGNASNNIMRSDLSALLLYNGLDALLEYEVGVRQMEMLNVKVS